MLFNNCLNKYNNYLLNYVQFRQIFFIFFYFLSFGMNKPIDLPDWHLELLGWFIAGCVLVLVLRETKAAIKSDGWLETLKVFLYVVWYLVVFIFVAKIIFNT